MLFLLNCSNDDVPRITISNRADVEATVQREASVVASCASAMPEIVSGFDRDTFLGESEDISEDDGDRARKTRGSDSGEEEDRYPMNDDDSDGDNDNNKTSRKETKTRVEPLPPVNHFSISYMSFRKDLYRESEEVRGWSEDEVVRRRREADVAAQGSSVPRPVATFAQTNMHADLLRAIAEAGFVAPTAVQAQTLPVALSGRDVIGLAKTGSGKTFSFLW